MKKNYTLIFVLILFCSSAIFSQPCNTPVSLPYTQDFQGVVPPALPPCTINQTMSPVTPNSKWQTQGPSNDIRLTIYVDVPEVNGNYWFYLPLMYFDASKSYKLTYKYSSSDINPASAQTLSVYYGTCTVNTCMTKLITTGVITNLGYLTATKYFTPAVSGNYYIGFNHRDKFGFPGNMSDIDSIVVADNGPLPVVMSPLGFTNINNQYKVYWQTYSEQNNQGFQIEQSADGVQFKNIGFVASKANNGNSQLTTLYEFTISSDRLASGNLFRLKQIDKDGKSQYSNIVNVSNKVGSVIINGNPVKDILQLTVGGSQTQKAHIRITDQAGRILIKNMISLNNGSTFLTQNLTGLSKGIYYLTITDQQERPIQAPLAFTKQ
jgi:Secretion system C-terminal sorting domain